MLLYLGGQNAARDLECRQNGIGKRGMMMGRFHLGVTDGK